MDIVASYLGYTRKRVIETPEESWPFISLGLKANHARTKFLPHRDMARGWQKVEELAMAQAAECIGNEDSYIWGNIFSPCEIMESLGLSTFSVEAMASYYSGFHLEDYYIDCAQAAGIAPTLCTYHKTFVGALESGSMRAPSYAVTTSLACDGNLNTFRYLGKELGMPVRLLDIPYEADDAAVDYLAAQLRDFAYDLAAHVGRPFDEDRLREVIAVENETRAYLEEFLVLQGQHYYPAEIISHMFLTVVVNLMMGTTRLRDLAKLLRDDCAAAPVFEGKTIMWVHLLPYYQETLKSVFTENRDYQLVVSDMVYSTLGPVETDDPFRGLAKKLIGHSFNGPTENKIAHLLKLADKMQADAAIHFCHWGCKQADGGSMMVKEALQAAGIPTLILDGDAVDKRNSHDGQIKTRLEAFFEVLDAAPKRSVARPADADGATC